jgi:hypothetical protein
MSDAQRLDFMVRKDNLREVRFSEPETHVGQTLEPGAAALRIDRYAFTANNITYALLGQLMRYWDFFPAPEGWGRVPVWGYAEVVASRASALPEGARVFGYLPMSVELRVRPEHVTDSGFVDASAHRQALPAPYQRYTRVQTSDDAANEDIGAVLKPLAGTGFLIADWLNDQAFFGARQVLVASASSKTALATAYHVSRRPERSCEVIGLTSPRNRAFCERTGYYDRVVEYERLEELPAGVPTTLVDMAGDPDVLRRVHTHFAAASLRCSCLVGLTHGKLAALGSSAGALPGPTPQLFSAPSHIESRRAALGPQVFLERVAAAEQAFLASARDWFEIERGRGPAAIEATYRKVLDGLAAPDRGYILAL